MRHEEKKTRTVILFLMSYAEHNISPSDCVLWIHNPIGCLMLYLNQQKLSRNPFLTKAQAPSICEYEKARCSWSTWSKKMFSCCWVWMRLLAPPAKRMTAVTFIRSVHRTWDWATTSKSISMLPNCLLRGNGDVDSSLMIPALYTSTYIKYTTIIGANKIFFSFF